MPSLSWAEVGQLAVDLTPTDRQVLGWLASHPFLTAEDLALVFDWDPRRARHLARRLLHRRLARLVTADEVGTALATPGRLEATVAGVMLAAADMGLSVSTAVRLTGLTGGGSEEPIGPRENLVRYFAHTVGVNTVCLDWYRACEAVTERGGEAWVSEWLTSAACSRKILRPDAYLLYQVKAYAYHAFLEYDRGTMSFRDLRAKFAIYRGYAERELYRRDYGSMPPICVITTTATAEARIARALASADVNGYLTALITRQELIWAKGNGYGVFGPIWRTRDDERHTRPCWADED